MSRKPTSGPRLKSHRLILPLGLRVLVKVLKEDDRTDTGLYLPEGAKERHDEALYGEVIEVARDKPTTEERAENVSGVPHGSRVLFKKSAGVRVPWDDNRRQGCAGHGRGAFRRRSALTAPGGVRCCGDGGRWTGAGVARMGAVPWRCQCGHSDRRSAPVLRTGGAFFTRLRRASPPVSPPSIPDAGARLRPRALVPAPQGDRRHERQ